MIIVTCDALQLMPFSIEKSQFISRYLWSVSYTQCDQILRFIALFKACGNCYFAQIAHIFRQFL